MAVCTEGSQNPRGRCLGSSWDQVHPCPRLKESQKLPKNEDLVLRFEEPWRLGVFFVEAA